MTNKNAKGVSLIEVMVVVVVLGVLVSVVAPSFADLLNRRRILAVAAEIATDLAYARSEAGIRTQNVTLTFMQVGGSAGMSCYTLSVSQSAFGSCTCTNAIGTACSAGRKEIRSMQLANHVGVSFAADSPTWSRLSRGKIDFVSPQMFPSLNDFQVAVEGRGGKLKIVLSDLGLVSTCSPDGSISGVRRCPGSS